MNLTEAEKLARDLMETHMGSLYYSWSFGFDNANRRFGLCDARRKRISLSKSLTIVNDDAHVRNTILHEIAHALTPGEDHGPVWKSVAKAIGCTGARQYGDTVVRPVAPFQGQCPNCGKIITAYRRREIACKACCKAHTQDRWDARFKFVWTRKP
jgi:predicted SprT family Zn-dependent metalloprotease